MWSERHLQFWKPVGVAGDGRGREEGREGERVRKGIGRRVRVGVPVATLSHRS